MLVLKKFFPNRWVRCIFLLLLFPAPPARAGDPLTLADCLSLARENNSGLLQAKIARERARVGVTSAQSAYYPTLDLSSESSYGSGGNQNHATSLVARYPLFSGGNDRARVRQARAEADRAAEDYRLTESEIILSLKEVFFDILRQQEEEKLSADILERRRKDLVLIKLKYRSGRESQPAVKESEANLLKAEYNRMAAERNLDLARTRLGFLLGKPRNERFTLVAPDPGADFPSRENLLAEAPALRPEVRAGLAAREVLAAQAGQSRSGYLPSLSLSAATGFEGKEFTGPESGWRAGANFSWNLFSGFSTRSSGRTAGLRLSEQDEKIRQLRQEIETEVIQAFNTWELARKKLELCAKTLEAARDMYGLTKLQYEQGSISFFFLQQKEDALTQAEYACLDADFALRLAQAGLEKAWGKDGAS
jgi:outer membrane protein